MPSRLETSVFLFVFAASSAASAVVVVSPFASSLVAVVVAVAQRAPGVIGRSFKSTLPDRQLSPSKRRVHSGSLSLTHIHRMYISYVSSSS